MGLPEAIESRLMRAMIEAVKQHRLRREREAVAAGEWRDVPAEPLALRPALHSPRPRLPSAASLVNAAGDGNDFALFVGGVLRGVGARVRLSSGCAANASAARVCQLFAEVRMGRQPARIVAWARSWLAGSKWVGKTYHYRLDRDGYAWLNLDYIDSRRIQRPGAPYKAFDAQTIYHDELLAWEVEGEEYDSKGQPRLRESPVHSLEMGLR
ncbi:hypothetical protein AB1Y20_012392 [Prymnesium parvum]|uniref:Uncharacterized protein n=1 Tax=Prymnesium parvum TaxID=97485 RepID=A0AB34IND8_PRYPA|mmetsp:Transcript_12692/g.31661  ORF Transcript_12692/g.31661 Transcript_12692/m.31661 type:complete len:211 (-) Transcript_12692:297-929(-)